ncbi:SAM-dependent methyltransferase [Bosea caraganae]|uniref:S-adenosyl-L-methionine-dependent methyltransferase n=1 Tax=Bosea caraganae TaxID=2763117 RepID=A0A370KYD7_9HYPH|nr:SAM-dependent methyltransferase [Bosea caraganae]RDJ20000.1 SAM-dependent methyltransferase [Bosea caraganae]RDJ23940.1 SAM-dependent methyltransferase [Bosea caraganae]
MREGEASNTARRVAVQRAAHQLFDVPLVFEDPLALRILGEAEEATLRSAAPAESRTPFALAFRAAVVARGRFCEDLIRAAVARGLRQVVLLGAGLDTLAYRDVLPADVGIFEVDHPATQAWKRQMLASAAIAVPSSVSFVPIDFDTTSLADGLRAGGLDLSRPTFFSWLGVVYYLAPETVLGTLRYLGTLASGGELAFDYFEPAQHYSEEERPGFSSLRQQVGAGGEPWKSYFEPAALAATLRSAGFGKTEDLDSSAMAARYFAGRDDGLEPTGPIHLVSGRIGAA